MSLTLAEEQVLADDVRGTPKRALRRRLMIVSADIGSLVLANVVLQLTASWFTIGAALSILFVASFWVSILWSRLYNSRLVTNRMEELMRVIRSGVRAVLVVAAAVAVTNAETDIRSLVALLSASIFMVLAEREFFRMWFKRRRRAGRSLWGTVLVADVEGGKQLRESIHANHTIPYNMVGHVSPDLANPEALLTKVLATARENNATGVMVVESSLDTVSTNFLVRGLLEAGLYVDLASALAGIATDRLATRNLGPSIATWIEPRPRHGWRAHAKRAFDVVVASVGLVMISPVFVGVALAVKLTSPGPIFFLQERVGRNGELFRMRKFRSMVVDAEERLAKLEAQNEGSGPLFKMKDDPRITKVGNFIRKTSLDELPQLINVLLNEMSLVGPRPALPAEMAQWDSDLYARLHVQPGITGMWQVSGRSSTSFDEYTRLDLYYVHNWSLIEDLTILAKTIPAVVKSDGAY